jgi:DnaJ-class molecular chaperone
MPALKIYAEQACSSCGGSGRVWEMFLDGEDGTFEDCERCNGTGRAFEYMWPIPLEAAECGVEVARASIHE